MSFGNDNPVATARRRTILKMLKMYIMYHLHGILLKCDKIMIISHKMNHCKLSKCVFYYSIRMI